MSQKKYASPLRLKIESSTSLLFVLLLAHLGALLLLAVSIIYWPVKLLLIFPVVMSLLRIGLVVKKIPLPGFNRWYPLFDNVVWDADESWILMTNDNRELRAILLKSSFVHPQLTVVNLKLINCPWYCRYRSLIFLPDNLDAETFRRLRVRLRWYAQPEGDSLAVTE